MSFEIAIKVERVSKCYQIYDAPRDRLKQFIMPRVNGLLGRDARPYFREFWALRDVSLDIRKGETVGIVGRNGSGKSTLLQMICGTLNPTSGNIETRGRIAALLELGSGFNPEFTGRENVYMNATVLGLKREEIEARFDDIAAFADIGHFLEQAVKTYSSGMIVRLAFAVQAMVDPDILVVDEALAVGDEKFQRKCFARLEDLKGKGTSIIFVSHSAASIIELCDRALLIDRGERVIYADPSNAIRAYHKIIYAPDDERKRLVAGYKSIDQSDLGQTRSATPASLEVAIEPPAEDVATYDPRLIPETTTEYPSQGARIESIVIRDDKKNVVNVLLMEAEYTIEISVRFEQDLTDIYFGTHIKNISGVEISGQRYPAAGHYMERVSAGAAFKISYTFHMSLLPGTYFVGGGIWSANEPNCAHRIIDALMFRVSPIEGQFSFGHVGLATRAPLLELQ